MTTPTNEELDALMQRADQICSKGTIGRQLADAITALRERIAALEKKSPAAAGPGAGDECR